ncbi:MAG: rhomboid family intramembrane serine protease [Chthonomonadaceae bacterium]|nr:rhomboid family intramembrane serine protease [Chthonomonadaceae bacterium]
MFLPYASDNPPTRRPVVTLSLIGVLTLLSFYVESLTRKGVASPFLNVYGILPSSPHPFSFFTYLFVNDGLDRLFINLCYLWVFGSGVEAAVGRGKFLSIFVAGGVIGGVMEWAVVSTILPPEARTVPITGASAACAGLMGLFAVRYYRAKLLFAFPPIRPHVAIVVTTFVVYEMTAGIIGLLFTSQRGGVAHWAHISGFIFGLCTASLMQLSGEGQRSYLEQDAAKAMEVSVPGQAIKRWESVLTTEPENALALKEMARAWNLLGDPDATTEYAVRALKVLLKEGKRSEAAHFSLEMRSVLEDRPALERASLLTPGEQLQLGIGLEESEAFAACADVLRSLSVHHPESPETEMALLKVITIYSLRLHRNGEADILTRLFLERYPQSQWRSLLEKQQQQQKDPVT